MQKIPEQSRSLKLQRQKEKYAENPVPKIQCVQQNRFNRKQNSNKTESFLKQIWEGPYYICTICHRCFYIRSVRKFDQSCYKDFNENLLFAEPSFDNCFYICNTCHQKVKSNKTPCQAVLNKLSIEPIPRRTKQLEKTRESPYISKDFV